MPTSRWAVLSAAAMLICNVLAAAPAQALEVVTSIKPIHSLTAAIMQGAGTPALIVSGAASPHAMALKPSQAQALSTADLVIWVGPQLERFLDDPLDALAGKATVLTLADLPDLVRLPLREGGAFEPDEDEDHGHGDETFDAHLWLDPQNAGVMADAITTALIAADPQREALYRNNLKRLQDELAALARDVAEMTKQVQNGRFIVFHDAYHYFENRFGLAAAGAITINPETAPGARRVAEIRQRIRGDGIDCVFAEPQFEPKIIAAIIDGTPAKSGTLDPLGASIPEGPEHYGALIRSIAEGLHACLSTR